MNPARRLPSLSFVSLSLVSSALLALFLLAAIIAVEGYVRFRHPAIERERLYRQAHCFHPAGSTSLLLLCPATTGQYLRPDGSLWTMTTDERAERILPKTQPDQPEVWWIGDSISMGYLLDDESTAPYRFAQLGYNVRNLGSDSLGTKGIAFRLTEALTDQDSAQLPAGLPVHIFWIYNTSDFVDDPKELRLEQSPLYRWAFRLHYELSRRSALYLLLRSRPADMNQLPPGFDAPPPDDHPTFANLKVFADDIERRGLSLTILAYPGMDPRTGKPALEDPTTARLVEFLRANSRQRNGRYVFDVVDLRPDFAHMQDEGQSPYVQGDGHPNEAAALLFAETAAKYLHHR